MKSLEQQFADWVSKQPADDAYNYGDTENCALCQFLSAVGMAQQPRVGDNYWREQSEGFSNIHTFSDGLADALVGEPSTFGALAERLNPVPVTSDMERAA